MGAAPRSGDDGNLRQWCSVGGRSCVRRWRQADPPRNGCVGATQTSGGGGEGGNINEGGGGEWGRRRAAAAASRGFQEGGRENIDKDGEEIRCRDTVMRLGLLNGPPLYAPI